MKSKPSTSSMPIAFSCSTTFVKLLRWISGSVVVGSDANAASVYNRYALPGPSRPVMIRGQMIASMHQISAHASEGNKGEDGAHQRGHFAAGPAPVIWERPGASRHRLLHCMPALW